MGSYVELRLGDGVDEPVDLQELLVEGVRGLLQVGRRVDVPENQLQFGVEVCGHIY